MVYNVKWIFFIICTVAVMVYLVMAAAEDKKSMEVTRKKHLIGLIPSVAVFLMYAGIRDVYELGIILLFVNLCILFGKIRIYGMADGFVFANLTLLFGGAGGISGIGLVILIMILACFSGAAEILLRKMVIKADIKQNKHIAFVPHILIGYVVVMVVLLVWL